MREVLKSGKEGLSPGVAVRSVLALSGVWTVLAGVNWLWSFSAAPHARALLPLLLGLGAIAGAGLGLLAMIAWRLLARPLGGRATGPVAFAAAVGILGAPAVWLLLGSIRALAHVRHRRPLALAVTALAAAGTLVAVVLLARLLQRLRVRPTFQGRFRLLRPASIAVGLILAAALAAYLGTGRGGHRLAEPPAPGPAGEARRPHIVLVSFDTLRPDHLSIFGHARPTSPRIDAAIREGALWTQAIASSSWTIPSHATLFTGASPSRIGPSMMERADSGRLMLPPESVTLAEVLRANGYRTAAFLGSAAMHRVFGFGQGFEVYDQMPPASMPMYADRLFFGEELRWLLNRDRRRFLGSLTPPLLWLSNRIYGQTLLPPPPGFVEHALNPRRNWCTAAEVNGKVRAFLDEDPQGPLFLFVHYFDVHSPFDAPPPHGGRWGNDGSGFGYLSTTGLLKRIVERKDAPVTPAEAERLSGLYDEEVAAMDEEFGRLLDLLSARGILDEAILVLFSDHGESLGDHGDLFHGNSLDEELVRILFAVRYPPRVPAGRRVDAPFGEVDIMPTILDLAGLASSAPATPEGRSWAGAVTGEATGRADERPVFSELYSGGMPGLNTGPFGLDVHSVRAGGWKLVEMSNGSRRLYRVSDDPGERVDLHDAEPELARRLGTLLAAWRAAGLEPGHDERLADPERLEQLKSLGYVGGGAD